MAYHGGDSIAWGVVTKKRGPWPRTTNDETASNAPSFTLPLAQRGSEGDFHVDILPPLGKGRRGGISDDSRSPNRERVMSPRTGYFLGNIQDIFRTDSPVSVHIPHSKHLHAGLDAAQHLKHNDNVGQ